MINVTRIWWERRILALRANIRVRLICDEYRYGG